MEEVDPQLATSTVAHNNTNDNEDGDEDEYVEDVTPVITRADIQTLNIIPGISLEEETPGQTPAYDSRWTIRKSFTDIPLTHRSFAGANKKTLGYELQGDSGANCTATDKKELLWEIKYFATPIQVKTFDRESNEEQGEHRTIQAIGAGILKMVDDNNHIVMDYYCLLIPNSTGTVISLDKFMRDDRSIVKFQQVGTVYGTGCMKLYDNRDQEINTVTMEERNGLWYASNPILIPLTSAGPTKGNTVEPSCHHINKMVTHAQDSSTSTDIDARQFYAVDDTPSEAPPNVCIRTAGVFSNMSKALKQLKLWHQRTGHLAPRTMRSTQKCVHGMPRCKTRHQSSTVNFAIWRSNASRTEANQYPPKTTNQVRRTTWTLASSEDPKIYLT